MMNENPNHKKSKKALKKRKKKKKEQNTFTQNFPLYISFTQTIN